MLQEIAAKVITPITILLEAYRVFNGALLVIFVPGVCGGRACLPQENFQNGSTIYRVVCVVNLVTLVAFMVLYAVEVRRENRLMRYLLVNPKVPSDSETVAAAFAKLPQRRQDAVHAIDAMYKHVIRMTIGFFTVNTVLSGYVILTEYANDKGPILFATGTVLIASKMYSIATVSSARMSAYTQKKIQFNDVNPAKIELSPQVEVK